MKIGIYSDVHISRNSSIIPLYSNNNDILTTRLKMCHDSLEFMQHTFKKENVDLIINCGDTFNAHTVSADELSVYSSYNHKYNNPNVEDYIREITLVGNHDMYNETFNAMNVKFNNVIQCNNPYYEYHPGECELGFISYEDDIDKFKEKLNVIIGHMLPEKKCLRILFMHGDINGSQLTGIKRIENHIEKDFLTNHFDIVINGHIHCHERIYNQNGKQIYNIGSLTTHSFADSNNHYGGCYILDTETGNIEFFKNPYQIIFRTYIIETKNDIVKLQESLNKDKYLNTILKIKCKYEYKNDIDKIINNFMNIIKCKYIFTYENNSIKETRLNENVTFTDIKDEFITFLSKDIDLKGNVSEYTNIIKEV